MIKLLKKFKNSKGFTLVELIVVIAVLGILAGIAIPRLTGVQDKARYAAGEALLANLKTPLELYRVENDGYPTMTETTSATDLGDEIDEYIDNYSSLLPDSSNEDWSFVSYEGTSDDYTLIIEHPNTDDNLQMTPDGISRP